jgi:superfamily II DNA helicase RecQ
MALVSKLWKHTMPESDEDVQNDIEARFGIRPCLWQIRVVRKILEQDDVITVAATGSGKSLTYWMPLLYVKHGIVVIVTPLKLLGKQFVEVLAENGMSAVSMTAANATNELFEVILIHFHYNVLHKN